MTFAAGLFGAVGMLVSGALIFLIVTAWREDREDRRERLSDLRPHSAPLEWDPLAELLEDAAPPARLVARRRDGRQGG
jgi:hypothetical protein